MDRSLYSQAACLCSFVALIILVDALMPAVLGAPMRLIAAVHASENISVRMSLSWPLFTTINPVPGASIAYVLQMCTNILVIARRG